MTNLELLLDSLQADWVDMIEYIRNVQIYDTSLTSSDMSKYVKALVQRLEEVNECTKAENGVYCVLDVKVMVTKFRITMLLVKGYEVQEIESFDIRKIK